MVDNTDQQEYEKEASGMSRLALQGYYILHRETIDRLRSEIEDLRISVIAFGAPWAVKYAEEWGLPPKHLDPRHYDILDRAGARMDDFIRGIATND